MQNNPAQQIKPTIDSYKIVGMIRTGLSMVPVNDPITWS